MPFRVVSGVCQGIGVLDWAGMGSFEQFWGEFGAFHCNQWGFRCAVVREQHVLPKLLWKGLVVKGEELLKIAASWVFTYSANW